MTKGNILIVDGFGGSVGISEVIRGKGFIPYHLFSQMKTNVSTSYEQKELSLAYIEHYDALVNAESYEAVFSWNNSKNSNIAEHFLNEFRDLNFCAVIPGAESGVELAEMLGAMLGLKNINDPRFSECRIDKYAMQARLKEVGLPYIPFKKVNTVEQCVEWYKESGFKKVVIKPLKSAGTDGVYVCNTLHELKDAAQHLFSTNDFFAKKNDSILLEKFIEGEEIAINTASNNGEHALESFYEYEKEVLGDAVLYLGTNLVKDLSPEYKDAVNYAFKVLSAFGIQYGCTHTEIKLSEDGPVLVEVVARLMGTNPILKSIQEALGYNEQEDMIDSYTDKAKHEKNVKREYKPNMRVFLLSIPSKITSQLSSVPALQTLSYFSCVREIDFSSIIHAKKVIKTHDLVSLMGEYVMVLNNHDEFCEQKRAIDFLADKMPRLLIQTTSDTDELSDDESRVLEQIKAGDFSFAD
jgi:biotin carboxylase